MLASPCVPSLRRYFKLTGPEPPGSFTSYVFVLGSKSSGPGMDLLHYITVLRWHCRRREKAVFCMHLENGVWWWGSSYHLHVRQPPSSRWISEHLLQTALGPVWFLLKKLVAKGPAHFTTAHISVGFASTLLVTSLCPQSAMKTASGLGLLDANCSTEYISDERNQSLYRFDQFERKRIMFFQLVFLII